VKCSIKYLPYIDFCFGVVVCTRAIYHQKLEGIQRTISEIRRVSRKRGFVLVDFLSKRTYSYGKGDKTEKGTFIETGVTKKTFFITLQTRWRYRVFSEVSKMVDITIKERIVNGKLRSRLIVTATART
jgi:ubiquinone/menaquinone biosynthesis C-methylase UbiE